TTIVIIAGTGIYPSIFLFPININLSDNPDIGVPFVYTMVTPLNIVIVDKVTIKACIFLLATTNPFIKPIITPIIKATIIDKNILLVALIMLAEIAPDIANVDPTDKSIPPVRITKDIPIANMALTDT